MKKVYFFVIILIIVIVLGIDIFITNKLNIKKIITNEELKTYVVKHEITKENWKDYLELKNLERVEENECGEIYRKIKYTVIVPREGMFVKHIVYIKIALKQEMIKEYMSNTLLCPIWNINEYEGVYVANYYHPLSIMLKDRDGDVNNIDVDYTFTIDDIEKVVYGQRNIYTVQIPSEKWQEDENGKLYIIIETSNGEQKEITSDDIKKVLEYI